MTSSKSPSLFPFELAHPLVWHLPWPPPDTPSPPLSPAPPTLTARTFQCSVHATPYARCTPLLSTPPPRQPGEVDQRASSPLSSLPVSSHSYIHRVYIVTSIIRRRQSFPPVPLFPSTLHQIRAGSVFRLFLHQSWLRFNRPSSHASRSIARFAPARPLEKNGHDE